MKLKVLIGFTDKNTNDVYSIGEEINVDDARGEELLADSRKLVELVEETPKAKPTKKTKE